MTERCSSSIAITAADDRGVPTNACCSCGWTWARPDDDPWADTLSAASRAHRWMTA